MTPATPPQAKLDAPQPAKARISVRPELTTKVPRSVVSRARWRNSRVRTAFGTQARPSTTTPKHRMRRTPVASGEPRVRATVGAANQSPAYNSALEPVARVTTVGANSRGSRAQRTTARLTPSSLKESRTAWATPPSAYRPQSRGVSAPRARITPVANVPIRITRVLIRLHLAAARTRSPRDSAGSEAAPGFLSRVIRVIRFIRCIRLLKLATVMRHRPRVRPTRWPRLRQPWRLRCERSPHTRPNSPGAGR